VSDFTKAQRQMLLDSEPDDRTGEEGCGVELCTGAHYATARALEKRGLGNVTGPGGFLPGMYWSNADGLFERQLLLYRSPTDTAAGRRG
jgi:hypothetical protein